MAANDFFGGDDEDDTVASRNQQEEKQIESLIVQTVAEIGRGANPEALLENLLNILPPNLRDKAKKRFAAAVAELLAHRKATQPVPARAAPAVNMSLKQLTALMAKQAFDKISALLKKRPDLQKKVNEVGRTMMHNGVVADMVRVSEADLGDLSPTAGIGRGQEKGPQSR